MFKQTIVALVGAVLMGAGLVGSAEAVLIKTTSKIGSETLDVVVDDVNNLEWLTLNNSFGTPSFVISRYSQYGFRWADAEDVNTIIDDIFSSCTPGTNTLGCSDYRLTSDNINSQSEGFWKGFSSRFFDLFDLTFPSNFSGSAAFFNDNENDNNAHLFQINDSPTSTNAYMKTTVGGGSDDFVGGYSGLSVFMVRDLNPQPQTPPEPVPEPLTILGSLASIGVGTVMKRRFSSSRSA